MRENKPGAKARSDRRAALMASPVCSGAQRDESWRAALNVVYKMCCQTTARAASSGGRGSTKKAAGKLSVKSHRGARERRPSAKCKATGHRK